MFVTHLNTIINFNTKKFYFINVTFNFHSIKRFEFFEFFKLNVFEIMLIKIQFRFKFFESNVFEIILIDLIVKSFKYDRNFMLYIAFINCFIIYIAFMILIAFIRIFSKRFEFTINKFYNCFKF